MPSEKNKTRSTVYACTALETAQHKTHNREETVFRLYWNISKSQPQWDKTEELDSLMSWYGLGRHRVQYK